jgi:hypothetical protein
MINKGERKNKMKNTLFVFVTKDGIPYDRTNGKNRRLSFDVEYPISNNGVVKFVQEEERIIVQGMNINGKLFYSKDITESGMYLISLLFAQKLPNAPKELRRLYRRLKELIGKPHFKIDVDENISTPYKLRLHTWVDTKGFNYRFLIKIKSAEVTFKSAREIFELIERVSKFNLKLILQHYRAFDENGIVVGIDEETIEIFEIIQSQGGKLSIS